MLLEELAVEVDAFPAHDLGVALSGEVAEVGQVAAVEVGLVGSDDDKGDRSVARRSPNRSGRRCSPEHEPDGDTRR